MVEALRGLGYSAATALADLIDNSLAAGAHRVELLFDWDGPASSIRIRDDGAGMSDAELELAMRLGYIDPLGVRREHDLGRFGLGLKTASFSQCRRLTVVSRKAGNVSCLRWDLDVLAASQDDGWYLLEGPDPRSPGLVELLDDRASGTVVSWDVLDRLVPPGSDKQHFLDLIDTVERHLAMVFHRFLDDAHPLLCLTINGKTVHPWDPFMTSHPATTSLPSVPMFAGGAITVRGYVLPHKDRLDSQAWESGGGPDGWTAQQGFYVYRNNRLLVAGSWLGLGTGRRPWTKEEPFKLARLQLDLPNSADIDWKIDIRKSRARPPAVVRDQLTLLAEDVRSRARRVFVHRGTPRAASGGPITQAWRAERTRDTVRYRIDMNHPAVRAVVDQAGGLLPELRAMLRILEETVPVQRIWLDAAESREAPSTAFEGAAPTEVAAVFHALFRNLRSRGISEEDARRQLARTEPFHEHPDLVASLTDLSVSAGGADAHRE